MCSKDDCLENSRFTVRIYFFKVKKRNTRTICAIFPELILRPQGDVIDVILSYVVSIVSIIDILM